MLDLRKTTVLGFVAILTAPASVFAAGGSSGYVSDAPIPWHMSQDEDGRNVIELIPQAETRLDLQLVQVTKWDPPVVPEAQPASATAGGETIQVATASAEAPKSASATAEPSLAVPYEALIYWADGTTWVYGEVSEHHYARLPVEVGRIEEGLVLLAEGPPQGTRIVTVGAAELFGAETGTGH